MTVTITLTVSTDNIAKHQKRKNFFKFAIKRFVYYTNHMDTDFLPWIEGSPSKKKAQNGVDLQRTIAENIATLVWYAPTNELFIRFINEFWHPNQLTCLTNREIPDRVKQKLIERIRGWEEKFTDSVYRATVILATRELVTREKEKHPNYKWINIKDIILLAQDLIQQENENHETARHDIGYTN